MADAEENTEIELKDTQPISQNEFDLINPTPDNSVFWGLLIWNPKFNSEPEKLTVDTDSYTIGRGHSCNITLSLKNCDRVFLSNVSREHFSIKRVCDPLAGNQIIVEDLSSNGTWVDGRRVGKGERRVLSNGDEISLSHRVKGSLFTFINPQCKQIGYPSVVTKNYLLVKLIGKGAFGEVHLGFLKQSSKKYAIKSVLHQIKNRGQGIDPGLQLINEAKVLCAVQHPCIVKVEDVIYGPESLHLILELMEGGDLYTRIRKEQRIPESTGKYYFLQIALAVEYLHKLGIVHRDLKPENILLSNNKEDAIVKITDFGFSKLVDDNTVLKTYCGTPIYLAPEVIEARTQNTNYTNACDIWSMAVILFVLLAGYHPFNHPSTRSALEKSILEGKVYYRSDRWKSVTVEGLNLVKGMLQVDPNKRPTIARVLDDTWLNDTVVIDKVQKIVFSNQDDPSLPLPKRLKLES